MEGTTGYFVGCTIFEPSCIEYSHTQLILYNNSLHSELLHLPACGTKTARFLSCVSNVPSRFYELPDLDCRVESL